MNPIRGVFARRTAVALLTLAVSASVSAQTANVATQSALSAIAIDNFGVVSPQYYRGALPVGRDFQDLAAIGVKTVIDLTSDDGAEGERAMVEAAGMSFVKIAMTTRHEPTAEELATFLKVVNDPAAQPVYVHCVGGRHRTGVMTAVYRMNIDGWNGAQAFSEMKKYKYGADFLHPEFKKFVLAYKPEVRSVPATQAIATIE